MTHVPSFSTMSFTENALDKTSRDSTAISWMIALARAHGLRAGVWNPLRGCERASTACRACWAASVAWRRAKNPNPAIAARHAGLTEIGADRHIRFNGTSRFVQDELERPLAIRHPTAFFSMSEGDLALRSHDRAHVRQVLHVMGQCDDVERGHVFLLLTKRPQAMADFLLGSEAAEAWNAPRMAAKRWPAANMMIGCSIDSEATAQRALPHMARLARAGWRVFVSYEPALGHVDWSPWTFLSWLIVGGEAGPESRPMHPAWLLEALTFAAANGIPAYGKQHGDWSPQITGGGRQKAAWVHPSGVDAPERPEGPGEWVWMTRVGKPAAGVPDGPEGRPVLQVPVWSHWRTPAAPALAPAA